MDREILVSLDLHGAVAFVGRLWCRTRKGRQSAAFEYDPGWLAHPERFALEPALMLAPGPFHTAPGRSLFGAVGDSMPDRWGRLLMRRAERRRARQEGRADVRPRVLSTAIDADDPSASVELALATVEFYGLEMNEAKTIARQVAASVSQWREVAAGLGAARRDIDRMASAFQHDDLHAALRF